MTAEALAHLQDVRRRLRQRSRLAKWMVRLHKISPQLAAWHVQRMTDVQVAEELERYAKFHGAPPLQLEVSA